MAKDYSDFIIICVEWDSVLYDMENIASRMFIVSCKVLTEPVAYEIILSSVNQHFDVILKEFRDSNFKVPHPI